MSEPKDYAVIDVETTNIRKNQVPKTKFWGYADSAGYKRFETSASLARFLRGETPKVLLHHANFDILQWLVDGEQAKILRSHNGRLIRCQIGKHQTLNTLSPFPVKLEEIFKSFGYAKTSLKDLAKRNYEDCVNGLDCFLRLDDLFVRLCGVSPLIRGTVAGTAFHAAELFMGRKMPTDLRFLDAYRGGRVEVFDLRCYSPNVEDYQEYMREVTEYNANREPEQPEHRIFEWIKELANKFDINSSYPKSIIDCPHTSELLRVEVRTKDHHCPLFQANREDMLCFPNGKFTSYVYRDVWERYIEPYAENTSVKVLSKHPIDLEWLHGLKDFIIKLYDTKNNADGGLKTVCKFLLNAMYGRIGLRGDSERARILDYRPDGDEIICYSLGRKRWLVFDTVQRECKSNFPFAAYITDNARGRLFEGFKRNNTLYGDTDSIICRNKNFVGNCGSRCGEWKDEGSEPFQAINVKDYFWGEEEVRKGGSEYLKWTLKQFARGKAAEEVYRERATELRKRKVLPSGETVPIVV